MIQYRNMSCCFIKVGKNWCLDTSFMYWNQNFVDLEDKNVKYQQQIKYQDDDSPNRLIFLTL